MLISREREKLINTVSFFASNVEKCGKVKLFKLLYFLDFEHYKITGRSVTGMDYYAWQMGPVPTALFDEIESPEPDMAQALSFVEMPIRGGKQKMLQIVVKHTFDDTLFTKRELKIMRNLVDQYKNSNSEEMIEATHLENLPWDKVFNQPNGNRAIIPYELSFRSEEANEMKRVAAERNAFIGILA